MKVNSVYVIGCGGTGSHLIEPLVRFLSYHENGTEHIVLADGDLYEKKNQERQLFDPDVEGLNKALVQKMRAGPIAPHIQSFQLMVDHDAMQGILDTGALWFMEHYSLEKLPDDYLPLVITAVDNMATRKMVLDVLDASPFRNWAVINPGNDILDGKVDLHVRWAGKDVTMDPRVKYENLRNPPDEIPVGCEVAAVSQPQHILANMTAATLCLAYVRALVDDDSFFDTVAFDMKKTKLLGLGSPFKFEPPVKAKKVKEVPKSRGKKKPTRKEKKRKRQKSKVS